MLKQNKPKVVKLSRPEVEGLLSRLDTGSLTADDKVLLKDVVHSQEWLQQALMLGRLSIRNLRRLIFGRQSEKQKKGCLPHEGSASGNSGEPASNDGTPGSDEPPPSGGGGKSRKPFGAESTAEGRDQEDGAKAKGHGRLGAQAYKTRSQVRVPHPALQKGDPCPEPPCPGHLYSIKAGSFIHVAGQSMGAVTEYVLEKLRCSTCGLVSTAPLPETVAKKGEAPQKYDINFKSLLALNRFQMGSPLYRQAGFCQMLGFPLPASTQWGLIEGVAGAVIPIIKHLEYCIAQGDLIHNDDTSIKILSLMMENKEDPNRERTGMYTTGIVGYCGDHKIVLFYSGRSHAGENLTRILAKRDKSLPPIKHMCDALSMNIAAACAVLLCHCLAHGRRKFVEIESLYPEECAQVLERIGWVYHYDQEAKDLGYDDRERLLHHQKHSRSIMVSLREYLRAQIDERRTEPNSVLGKAIGYLLKHWSELTRFLEVEGVPLDNNVTERALKALIRSRRNSLFQATPYSAQMAGYLMGVISTCHENGVNPLLYLNAVQTHRGEVTLHPGQWLPWNYQTALQAIESVIAQRQAA